MEKFMIASGLYNISWNILVWTLEMFLGVLKLSDGNGRIFFKKLKLFNSR